MKRARGQEVVERAKEVGLLASPARQEIVDTLDALGGEASVAQMAAQLGRPSDGLYYHLRILERGGLVEELTDAGDGRRYRTRARGGERLRLRYRPGKTENARAVARVAAGMLRIAERDFAAALGKADVAVEGPARALWAARTKGWVGDAEVREINRLLARLLELLHRERGPRRERLLSLTWVLAPVAAKPVRRE
jgi:DNA-binding transcriptional ArsR family regulator